MKPKLTVQTTVKCGGERHVVGLKNGAFYTQCPARTSREEGDFSRCAQIYWSWVKAISPCSVPYWVHWDPLPLGRSQIPGKLKRVLPKENPYGYRQRQVRLPTGEWRARGEKRTPGWKATSTSWNRGGYYSRSDRWQQLCRNLDCAQGIRIPQHWGPDYRSYYYLLRELGRVPLVSEGRGWFSDSPLEKVALIPEKILRLDSKRRILGTLEGTFVLFASGRTRKLHPIGGKC